MSQHVPRRRRSGLVAAGFVLVGCAGCAGSGDAPVAGARQLATPVAPRESAERQTDPTRVEIPRIAASSSLIPLALQDSGALEDIPFDQPQQAGWYSGGSSPGEPGTTVVVGHVRSSGRPGVFARLQELRAGDRIRLTRADGRTVEHTVYRTQLVPQARFPTDSVYRDEGPAELRVVTCAGRYDARHRAYTDSFVVYARPVD